jgi:transposase
MLVVETIARIRREYFVKGKSIKEIVRDLKVSRNTVRKVLRSGATAFSYERAVQPLPKLGRWKDELDRLLASNEAKPGRERLTLIRLFEELSARGYTGGYDAVCRYARSWRKAAQALREGVHSSDVIINILARRREPAALITILTLDALRLRHHPAADCDRYNSLRRVL